MQVYASAHAASGATLSGTAGKVDNQFSVVAAVLGTGSEHAGVPDSWLLRFSNHADAAVWRCLFRSCRAGRTCALTYAPQLGIVLQCHSRVPDADWQRQVAATQRALSVRGPRPTRLTVDNPWGYCDISELVAGRLMPLPGQISGWAEGITELKLNQWGLWDYRPFLDGMAGACPNIVSYLTCFLPKLQLFTLPAPAQWPRLTSLILHYEPDTRRCDPQEVWPRVAPYMTQLTTLQLPASDPHADEEPSGSEDNTESSIEHPWHLLFPPSLPTTLPLVSLDVGDTLTDGLLSKLLTHAPNLRVLSVSDVEIERDEFMGRVWGLEKLHCDNWPYCAAGLRELRSLVGLPRPRTGRIVMSGSSYLVFEVTSEGIDAAVAECLAHFSSNMKRVSVVCDGVSLADQPAALQRTLCQLGALQAPDATVWLQGWHWPAVADTVADSLPLLPDLAFGWHADEPLTDELLAAIRRMGPHMRRLSVPSLALQSDHSGAAWPWSVLCVRVLDVAQLLRLPAAGPKAQLRLTYVSLAACDSLQEADLERVQALFQRVQCAWRCESREHASLFEPTLVCRLQGEDVQRQLGMLQRMRFERYPSAEGDVQVVGWRMTGPVLSALLSGLPTWGERLTCIDCEWPLTPTEYTGLGANLPVTYSSVCIQGGHTLDTARCVCDGAVAQRRCLGPGFWFRVHSDACQAQYLTCINQYDRDVSLYNLQKPSKLAEWPT